MAFTHLHLHTKYSFLDGAIKIKELMPHIKKLGMNSVAITDHGTMHGVIEFYKEAKRHGIKPIIGCEAYISLKGMKTRERKDSYHLILLAKNNKGYRNLMYLASMAFSEGFYYKPRIDFDILKKHSEGLIGLSACLGGVIARHITNGEIDRARELALEFKNAFEEDSYYLELQDNKLDPQYIVNDWLIEFSKELDIPLVATSDAHYLEKKDAEAHNVLMMIQMKRVFSQGLIHNGSEYYVKTQEEMEEAFNHVPEAISNTQKIVDMCNVEIELGKLYLPDFPTPNNMPIADYFKQIAQAGLEKRLKENNITAGEISDYQDRFDFELSVISKMGFEGYFLIVWDFIKYAKDNNIVVGPGRGSGAGSIIAYSLEITDLDPIPLGLLFERFLNPERISMPDFDIDFCQAKREKVIEYVRDRYGKYRVAQIASFSQLKAKSVIKDVARVLEQPFSDANRLAKLIPDGEKVDLIKAMDDPDFSSAIENNPVFSQIYKYAKPLEGLYRQQGVHAAGLVISNKDVWDYAPVSVKDGTFVCQFEKDNTEEVGLVKFDFLGLKTLTVIDKAVEYINANRKSDNKFDISKIDIKDDGIYEIFRDGATDGVFQFESSGLKKYLRQLKPDCFGDIIAMNALYRPGPIEYIPSFIKRKAGLEEVKYDHPAMEEILSETYGITVYQEQVMALSIVLGGFTKGEADTLRKAMGKKKLDLLEKLFPKFRDGCKKLHQMSDVLIQKIWDDWLEFAKYAFNKSHSACYSYIAVQTAYLKRYHPAEFMASFISSETSETDKLVKHISSSKEMGLIIIPPDINRSNSDFTVEDSNIIFGLEGIKGVGASAINHILEQRDIFGKFKDPFDFICRVAGQSVNKAVIIALIKSGALDSLNNNRQMLLDNTELAVKSAIKQNKQNSAGLKSLFGESIERSFNWKHSEDMSDLERLTFEKEVLGFYISGHPVEKMIPEISMYGLPTISELSDDEMDKIEVSLLCVVDQAKPFTAKSGKKMCSVTLSDHTGSIDGIIFSGDLSRNDVIISGSANNNLPLWVTGKVKYSETDGLSMNLTSSQPASILRDKISRIGIILNDKLITDEDIKGLRKVVQVGGLTEFNLNLYLEEKKLTVEFKFLEGLIHVTKPLIEYVYLKTKEKKMVSSCKFD